MRELNYLTKSRYLFLLFFLLITTSTSIYAKDNCLDENWRELNSNYQFKKFDRENDTDKRGQSYSCHAFLTPKEIDSFLKMVRRSVAEKDKVSLSKFIRYPLFVGKNELIEGENDRLSIRSYEIQTEEEFISEYDEIITDSVAESFMSAELENMFVVNSNGVFIGNGEVIFSRNFDLAGRIIRITHIREP